MLNLDNIDIQGKKCLIRVDFNVPMDKKGNITDDNRILAALPTIKYALKKDARVIIMSHMGRPKGRKISEFSLAPVAKRLSELLKKPVTMASDCIGEEVKALVSKMSNGDIILLENLRFHKEEQENDDSFAKKLASLYDIYINDAFAVAHRTNASVTAITRYAPLSAAGFLLKKELDYFHKVMNNPARPLVAIIGGAKVSSKLKTLKNMLHHVDKIIIGGAMANTFLKSMGNKTGKSLTEDDLLNEALDLIKTAEKKGVKFYLPIDAVVADRFDAKADNKIVSVSKIPSEWMIMDIGPTTALLYGDALKDAKTIIWNGPMGVFEMDAFGHGTMAVLDKVVNTDALTIVGGGDMDLALHQSGKSHKITYISTGGGAFLTLLEGKTLAGVAALDESEKKMEI